MRLWCSAYLIKSDCSDISFICSGEGALRLSTKKTSSLNLNSYALKLNSDTVSGISLGLSAAPSDLGIWSVLWSRSSNKWHQNQNTEISFMPDSPTTCSVWHKMHLHVKIFALQRWICKIREIDCCHDNRGHISLVPLSPSPPPPPLRLGGGSYPAGRHPLRLVLRLPHRRQQLDAGVLQLVVDDHVVKQVPEVGLDLPGSFLHLLEVFILLEKSDPSFN